MTRPSLPIALLSFAIAIFMSLFPVSQGFTCNFHLQTHQSTCDTFQRRSVSLDGMKAGDAEGWLAGDDDDEDEGEHENKEFVTKKDFMKQMMEGDATIRRKKKNGKKNGYTGYKVMDNRDALPFVVQVATPDPYTSGEEMKREARKNSKRDLEKKKHTKKKPNVSRHNLVGMDARDGIASSIYSREKDGSLHKVLGQYTLDKSTNCGDIIEITVGDECREFEVMKTRCQYKYAGGKRFVMVRKILEVKERTRIAQEEFLMKSLELPSDDDVVPEAERL